MTRLLWLADTLRDAGLSVMEHPGWQTRGRDGGSLSMRPRIVIVHHTATHPDTKDSVVTNLLVNGRADLPGPLCHLGLNRAGTFIVIAAGKANHAGSGKWEDANESVEAIGIEAYNWGNGVPFPSREPWPEVQLEAYARGVAALLEHIGRDQRHVCAHREWALPAGRKPDPSGINMQEFRLKVGYLLADEMTVTQARLELAAAWHARSGVWMTPQPPETAQARLTRLASEVASKARTVADIVQFAPVGVAVDEPIPAWVVDATIPTA